MAGDACVDPDATANNTVINRRDVTPRNCDGNFLSARNQREVLYGGDDHPRLYTGEGTRTGGGIDTSKVDVPSPSGKLSRPITAYLGSLRIDYQPDAAVDPADVDAVLKAPGVRSRPDDTVNVDFRKATLDYVLKQLLGGALGLNYIAPDDLGGSITFRTEQPIPKSRILPVVRDLLARNGFEMRSINGIYHVGRPDLIASMEGVSEAGRGTDRLTRIVRLKRSTGAEIAALAKQMLPSNVSVVTTNSPDTLLLRAPSTDIDQAESILKNLAASDTGEDRVAIIPLHQSAPDQIASQLGEIYHSRGADVTIVPLVQQQGILVTTRDASIMKGVRSLARVMDTEVRDEVALRLIPLKHLSASDTAERLAAIYGGGGGTDAGGNVGRNGGSGSLGSAGLGSSGLGTGSGSLGSGGTVGGGSLGSSSLGGGSYPTPPASDVVQDGPSTAYPSPTGPAGGGAGSSGGRGGYGGGGRAGSRGGGADGGQTKIVADKTSNSVMVYSTYATFKRIREVLQALDIAQAQVVIEATIVEVTLNDQIQQGVQFFLTGRGFSLGSGDVSSLTGGTASGTSVSGTATTGTTGTAATGSTGTTTTGTGTGSALTTNNGGALSIGVNISKSLRVDAVLSALQGITKVKVISSPYLTVTNGKQARLVVGDQIPYSTRTQSSNNLGNNTTTNEVTIKDTGIVLDITPDIHANNEVTLKISQSVSTPSESSPLGGVLTPVISTRSVDSEVLLQSGRTVLLGGLIQDRLEQQEGGVPVLRTVPGLGDLFKSKTDSVQRVELILMLTPRVTRSASQIEDLAHLVQAQVHTR